MRTILIAMILGGMIFSFGCRQRQPQVETNEPAAQQKQQQPGLKEQEKLKAQENITKENMNQELEKIEGEIRQDIKENQ